MPTTTSGIALALMPLTYALVGWLTNVVALKMTFYPIRFFGIPPYLGWQGIVPRKSKLIALQTVKLVTEKLLQMEEFFSRVDPDQLEKEFTPILAEKVPGHVEGLLRALGIEGLSDGARAEIAGRVAEGAASSVRPFAEEMRTNIGDVFNFKNYIMRNLTGENSKRIVDIFLEVGSAEFRFIERSGLYFGLLLGLVQVGIWSVYPLWWTLPLQGVFVGWITNWLAIQLIFHPRKERKFGPFRIQGLFLKRQMEVSQKYCRMFGERILAPDLLMQEILYKRTSRAVHALLEGALAEVCARENVPFDADRFEAARREAGAEFALSLAGSAKKLERYMSFAMNIEKVMYAKMSALPPEEFEPILRTAFEQDEYVLIALGAILGGLVGLAQALLMG